MGEIRPESRVVTNKPGSQRKTTGALRGPAVVSVFEPADGLAAISRGESFAGDVVQARGSDDTDDTRRDSGLLAAWLHQLFENQGVFDAV